MRRLLGVLRGENGSRVDAPSPGVADLPQLISDVCAAGVPATLEIRGNAEEANPAMELSVYRIVQEALTNVIKHAGNPTDVRVVLDYLPNRLEIDVTDNGRGVARTPSSHDAAQSSVGHGLMGMRERVDVWGGTMTVGLRAGGGYRVQVTLPNGDDG